MAASSVVQELIASPKDCLQMLFPYLDFNKRNASTTDVGVIPEQLSEEDLDSIRTGMESEGTFSAMRTS